uniref:gamma-glutamylcyclotransferase n=1 Tax=Alexandrium catenella TaxID=2925 RepID=A0A7S1RIX6_ALECA
MGSEAQWCFSFGANMSRSVLRQSGVATVAESLPGLLPSWRICFNYVGYDGVEPRFANIEPFNADEAAMPVHGVAHRLGSADLAVLDDIEDEGVSYRRVRVPFQGYDGHGLEVWAYTAVPEWVAPGVPSARYLAVLVQGARAHGLRYPYTEWLAAHPCLAFGEAARAPLASSASPEGSGCRGAGPSVAGGPLDFRHRPGDTDAAGCRSLRIAGDAFHVPLAVLRQRSFLRSMARDGGTVFALRTLGKAYAADARTAWPDFSASCEDDFPEDTWRRGMSELQADYVACWKRYLEAHFSAAPVAGSAL